jgi:hypothetical protein
MACDSFRRPWASSQTRRFRRSDRQEIKDRKTVPGRLHTNFRSGNLAENLGILLLRGLAAVADVTRTEDVGIDAIATLLRRDAEGSCYAEDSFVVQLKSDSETCIEYSTYQLSWFLAQSQPMFIGVVSRRTSSISLYPTLYANQAVLALHAVRITIHLCKSDNAYPWDGGADNSATVWLGPPLLSWTLAEMENANWIALAYEIMKHFLEIARREYELLSLGQCSEVVWATNDKQSIRSSPGRFMKGQPGRLQALSDQCIPALNALMVNAVAMPKKDRSSLVMPLLSLVAGLRDLGVHIDRSTTDLAAMLIAWSNREGD